MPMDFPDHASVVNRVCEPEDPTRAARLRSVGLQFFRRPSDGESEAEFREAAADFVRTIRRDPVEAAEIRTGRGWDRQSSFEILREVPGTLELVVELIDQRHPRSE